ncbi:Epoxide hydrolase [Cordyceps fumosorosea ARSEF 2679]|uniref:Epoxide hydrolase n=1 Tax=Cordyceps fumosorosea (strain ARSEF 2679) TaxID=1081104 RepID=A0A167M305_CORFA|nr:Epoxide hydrolase [Cordyceps fumosorosea ARSEF 2679]OAA53849.1 Epoxide hydrolase [Cordyceps fumosorosea ARSEF 2679]
MVPNKVQPFKIAIPQKRIDILQKKLQLATLPEEVSFSDVEKYGASRSDIKRLVEYWKDGFDWRAQEAELNKLPQFTTTVNVDGFGDLEIHFIHQRSGQQDSIPLLFCHGWPGSFLEVSKIMPLLTEPKEGPSFHLVAPSLPNFGFSDKVNRAGFSISQYAEAIHKVMLNLGYTKYATQGGDWGFFITRSVAAQFPEHCLASHVNMQMIQPSATTTGWFGLYKLLGWFTKQESEGLERLGWYLKEGSGYLAEQSTKPLTIGYSLADSPVGLLAWVYEKLQEWTDDYPWTDDEILTWVSIYQFSKAGPAASTQIYYEARHAENADLRKAMGYVPVPLGVSSFPKDISPIPLSFCKALGPVVFQKRHEQGGHFAAYEKPQLLVRDVQDMFGSRGGAYDVAVRLRSKTHV